MRMLLLSFFATSIQFAGLGNDSRAGVQNWSQPQSTSPGQSRGGTNESAWRSTITANGYDSGLWRFEYLPHTENDTANTANSDDAFTASSKNDSTTHNTNTVGEIDGALTKLINNDMMEFATISVPIVTETADLSSNKPDSIEMTLETMSDWDYASSFINENKQRAGTANGPSATSVIVGVVGVLIVIGAYVSSGKRATV